MLLVVDVGNTQTHFGVYREGAEEISEHWRFATVRESTGDELAAALSNLLELRGLTFDDVDASIISSTVPQLVEQWTQVADRYLGHGMLVVGPAIKTGMPIRIDNPHEVGADRLVNAVAAYERIRGTCIVVDFGTAITYDAVSDAGEYLGGIITPGAEISMDALYERAAKLPKVEMAEPRSLIGKSTVDAIRSGIAYGFAGQVEGIVRRLRGELGDEAKAIATGGLARVVVPFIRETIDEVDDLLTLTGLRLIWREIRAERRPAGGPAPRASGPRWRPGSGRRSAGGHRDAPRHRPRRRRAASGWPRRPGASSISSGTSQASRARASISPAPSARRMVAIAPRRRNSASRSSSTWGARSRSPMASPAPASGSPAARRSDCSAAD